MALFERALSAASFRSLAELGLQFQFGFLEDQINHFSVRNFQFFTNDREGTKWWRRKTAFPIRNKLSRIVAQLSCDIRLAQLRALSFVA